MSLSRKLYEQDWQLVANSQDDIIGFSLPNSWGEDPIVFFVKTDKALTHSLTYEGRTVKIIDYPPERAPEFDVFADYPD